MTTETNGPPNTSKRKYLWPSVVVATLFALGIVGSIVQPGITDTRVNIIAQNYVKDALRSPSTADFPSYDYNVSDLNDGKYKVVSYVDSENGFGAMIRSNYSATLSFNGGDWADPASWTLYELILDGKVIYEK